MTHDPQMVGPCPRCGERPGHASGCQFPLPEDEPQMVERVAPIACRCGYQWAEIEGRTAEDYCTAKASDGGAEYIVICPHCLLAGELRARPEWAIKAWNFIQSILEAHGGYPAPSSAAPDDA